jgi:hypothetical protein
MTRALDFAPDGRLKRLLATYSLKADVVIFEAANLFAQELAEQPHQRFDLKAGALPVLRRERVQREIRDAQTRRRFYGCANGFRARAVTGHSRLRAASSPPPIAIHDNGYVRGKLVEFYLPEKEFVSGAALYYTFEIFEDIIAHSLFF